MKSAERVTLTPACVLHHHEWRETSRIVEIFSRDHGRLGAVARGARRAQSPWRAVLQPFRPLLLSWTGGGDLVTLIGAEADGAAVPLPGSELMSAYYMNELLLCLLPRHDAQPGLFRHYAEALARLRQSAAPALRIFEKQLLSALGYGLMLERDAASNEPLQPDAVYSYELERGPVRAISANSAGLQITGAALAALAREDLTQPGQLQQTRELLQVALERLLGNRSLRTRTVARAVVRSTRSR
ncbi:MAG: DNA repair protein RecO [Gammaproteobacteria bacterium]|nr:DNA repair protein RecO [Gammaproteobacteria bacterium]